MDGWDAAAECSPVCWVVSDGGWAADAWELWRTVAHRDGMDGVWTVDWNAFRCAVPEAVFADDEERMELMRALKLCANVLNNPEAMLFPDEEDAA